MAIEFYNEIKSELQALGFEITNQDLNRPWGAFFYINENQAQEFSDHFFGSLDVNKLKIMQMIERTEVMLRRLLVTKYEKHAGWMTQLIKNYARSNLFFDFQERKK